MRSSKPILLLEDDTVDAMTVKRALSYARLMAEAGLTEPYRVLWEEPKEASRWKKKLR